MKKELFQPHTLAIDKCRFDGHKVTYTFKYKQGEASRGRLVPMGKIAIWSTDQQEYFIELNPVSGKTVPLYLDARMHPFFAALINQTVELEGSIEIKLNSNLSPCSAVFRPANAELISKLSMARVSI